MDLGEPGRVVEQQPVPDTEANVGSPVAVWFSRELQVPNVVGSQTTEADAQLRTLHLQGQIGEEVASPKARGEVLATDPVAGTRVLENAIVRYRITSGRNPVPILKGTPTDEVDRTLNAAGFLLGTLSGRPDPGPKGFVLEQDPPGAEMHDVGTRVDVVISSDLPIVPNVVDQNDTDAERMIRDKTFTPQRAGEQKSPRPRGTVLRTDPSLGTWRYRSRKCAIGSRQERTSCRT